MDPLGFVCLHPGLYLAGLDIEALQEKIFLSAGREFNIASPKQLGIILYEKLKLVEKPRKTATGQYSTQVVQPVHLSSMM